MIRNFSILLMIITCSLVYAQDQELSAEDPALIEALQADTIEGQSGEIILNTAHCTLRVPEGFVFLNPSQSKHLLVDVWDNPQDKVKDVLGVLVSEDAVSYDDVETAYLVYYEDIGYVSDNDAESINYNDLLKSLQDDIREENKINPDDQKWELLGWAWQPTYDNQKKVLSWAKHYRFNGNEVINYDVRVLGKDGIIVITAVTSPEWKEQLIADNDSIVNSVVYDKGYTYADFNPDKDHVAEWTIGGLIAGKVLAKAGFWAILAKFSKIIIIAIIAFFASMRKKIARLFGFGKKEE